MEYKVIPFSRSEKPAESLQSIIKNHAVDGWEYSNHQYSDKLTPGTTGCFGIGAEPDYVVHVGMIVFYKS